MSARAQAARGYRLKPAPRSRARRAGRIHWDRVGRIALVLVFFAILASYVGPSLHVFEAWRDSRAEHSKLGELRTENAKLRERIETMSGDDAAALAARKQGMTAPGEGAYVIRGLGR